MERPPCSKILSVKAGVSDNAGFLHHKKIELQVRGKLSELSSPPSTLQGAAIEGTDPQDVRNGCSERARWYGWGQVLVGLTVSRDTWKIRIAFLLRTCRLGDDLRGAASVLGKLSLRSLLSTWHCQSARRTLRRGRPT